MPKPCPKCLGSGLASSAGFETGSIGGFGKCHICGGKGWLADDSKVNWKNV